LHAWRLRHGPKDEAKWQMESSTCRKWENDRRRRVKEDTIENNGAPVLYNSDACGAYP